MYVRFACFSWQHSPSFNYNQHLHQGNLTQYAVPCQCFGIDCRIFYLQYYWAALAILLFYDYSLTLQDEVRSFFFSELFTCSQSPGAVCMEREEIMGCVIQVIDTPFVALKLSSFRNIPSCAFYGTAPSLTDLLTHPFHRIDIYRWLLRCGTFLVCTPAHILRPVHPWYFITATLFEEFSYEVRAPALAWSLVNASDR